MLTIIVPDEPKDQKTKPKKVKAAPTSTRRSPRLKTAKPVPFPFNAAPPIIEPRQDETPSIRSALKTLAKAVAARGLKLGLPKWKLPKFNLPALALPNTAPAKQALAKILSRIS